MWCDVTYDICHDVPACLFGTIVTQIIHKKKKLWCFFFRPLGGRGQYGVCYPNPRPHSSQPVIIAGGEIIFYGSISITIIVYRRLFLYFPLFAFFCFCFWTCFFCAHHEEGTDQAATATAVSTYLIYRKHSRTACNRPWTEQQSTYQYARVDQSATTQASRQGRVLRPMLMETRCYKKTSNFKDTRHKISVPLAMSTNLHKTS